MVKVWGTSDDLVEIEGDIRNEFGCYGTDDSEHGVLVVASDGTAIEVQYGKGGKGIWEIKPLKIGPLFDRIEYCTDEEATPYSDVCHFKDGIKWMYAAKEWEEA